MRIGDLVKVKNVPWKIHGIVLEINGQFKWAEVYWIETGQQYAFFAEDLEVISENR